MRREVDVPERDDRRRRPGRPQRADQGVEVGVAQAGEDPAEVERSSELLPEFRGPRPVVLGEGTGGKVVGAQRRVGDARGRLGADHPRVDSAPRQRLDLRGRVADQEDALAVALRDRADRDPRGEVGVRVLKGSTEATSQLPE